MIGETRCDPEAVAVPQVCGDADGDTCLDWLKKVPCQAGQICRKGICINSECSDECSYPSIRKCDAQNGSGYVECGEFDTDPCFEFGPFQECSQTQICQDGFCIQDDTCHGINANCDDGDDCTRDECNPDSDQCEYILEPRPGAEDISLGIVCSNDIDDDCDGFVDGQDPDCQECETNLDCDDDNPCTQDSCVKNGTQATCLIEPIPDGSACEDSLYCTTGDQCRAGNCLSGIDMDCDDGDDCTHDECNEADKTCSHFLVPRPGAEEFKIPDVCENHLDDDCDGLIDNQDPSCWECEEDVDCDDSNPCTLNTCTDSVCQNDLATHGTPCNDSQFCTTNDHCSLGICVGEALDCSHLSDDCNVGVCSDMQAICLPEPRPDGSSCEDGLFCTIGDQCQSGACISGVALDCSDGDICTINTCNEDLNQCESSPSINLSTEGPHGHANCANGLDDDCDGKTDSNDPDCKPTCGGVEVDGHCWYRSEAGKSCTQKCSSHGGYSEATRTYAGYPEGSRYKCRKLGQEFVPHLSFGGLDAGYGLGCFNDIDHDDVCRDKGSVTTANALHPRARRFCACNN